MGLEVVVGFLLVWAARKAKHVGEKVDGLVDKALDASLDRMAGLISGKLGHEPALEKLRTEAGETSERTRTRVELALAEAVEEDPAFAENLRSAVAEVEQCRQGAGGAGTHLFVSGDVNASSAGIAIGGIAGGNVSIASTSGDPRKPERD